MIENIENEIIDIIENETKRNSFLCNDIGFKYRKSIILTSGKNKSINYTKMIIVHRYEGEDVNDYYLFLGNKCKEDYSDITFTTEDGTKLKHQIELHSNQLATIMVHFINIKPTPTVFYLYYGDKNNIHEYDEITKEFLNNNTTIMSTNCEYQLGKINNKLYYSRDYGVTWDKNPYQVHLLENCS